MYKVLIYIVPYFEDGGEDENRENRIERKMIV